MTWIAAKSLLVGTLTGAILSIAFSLVTASVSGRNAMTGEAMELTGIQAIYFHLAEYGPASYFASLLPSMFVFSTLVTIIFAVFVVRSGSGRRTPGPRDD